MKRRWYESEWWISDDFRLALESSVEDDVATKTGTREIYIYRLFRPYREDFPLLTGYGIFPRKLNFIRTRGEFPQDDWSRASWIDETERDRFRRDTYLFSGRYIIIKLTNAATWLPSTSRGFQISRFESGFQAGRSLVTVDNFLPPRLYTHLSLCWWVSISFNGEDFGGIFFVVSRKKRKKRKSFLHGFIFFSVDIFFIKRAIKKILPRRDKNKRSLFQPYHIRNNFLYSVDPIRFQLVFEYIGSRTTGFLSLSSVSTTIIVTPEFYIFIFST